MRETTSPEGTTESYQVVPGIPPDILRLRLRRACVSMTMCRQPYQSSLRDSSMEHSNPGLRPGLSTAVPTGLDRHRSHADSLSPWAFSQISNRLCSIKCRVSIIGSTSESDSIE